MNIEDAVKAMFATQLTAAQIESLYAGTLRIGVCASDGTPVGNISLTEVESLL